MREREERKRDLIENERGGRECLFPVDDTLRENPDLYAQGVQDFQELARCTKWFPISSEHEMIGTSKRKARDGNGSSSGNGR